MLTFAIYLLGTEIFRPIFCFNAYNSRFLGSLLCKFVFLFPNLFSYNAETNPIRDYVNRKKPFCIHSRCYARSASNEKVVSNEDYLGGNIMTLSRYLMSIFQYMLINKLVYMIIQLWYAYFPSYFLTFCRNVCLCVFMCICFPFFQVFNRGNEK